MTRLLFELSHLRVVGRQSEIDGRAQLVWRMVAEFLQIRNVPLKCRMIIRGRRLELRHDAGVAQESESLQHCPQFLRILLPERIERPRLAVVITDEADRLVSDKGGADKDRARNTERGNERKPHSVPLERNILIRDWP